MALVDKSKPYRLPVPGEPDAWFEFLPITWAESKVLAAIPDAERPDAIIRVAIVGWSYPEPVTPENIERLEVPTITWAFQEVTRRMHGRDPGQGEASAPGSLLA